MSEDGAKKPRWGGYRRGRNHKLEQVERLIADISAENKARLRLIATARGKNLNECVDEMIEADWIRRQRRAAKAADSQVIAEETQV